MEVGEKVAVSFGVGVGVAVVRKVVGVETEVGTSGASLDFITVTIVPDAGKLLVSWPTGCEHAASRINNPTIHTVIAKK